jgi:hypothetical protein
MNIGREICSNPGIRIVRKRFLTLAVDGRNPILRFVIRHMYTGQNSPTLAECFLWRITRGDELPGIVPGGVVFC